MLSGSIRDPRMLIFSGPILHGHVYYLIIIIIIIIIIYYIIRLIVIHY